MLCLSCAASAIDASMCDPCVRSLRFAPIREVGPVTVQPVFNHSGAAARLVHNLKYRRSMQAGRFLAFLMAARLPADATSLVPVPRVLSRRIRYGIDQTAVLASIVSDLSGLPVVNALVPPVWNRRSAGKDRSERLVQSFGRRAEVDGGAVLIDDVCTTGATLFGAYAALGVDVTSLVATSASNMRTGAAIAAPRR